MTVLEASVLSAIGYFAIVWFIMRMTDKEAKRRESEHDRRMHR